MNPVSAESNDHFYGGEVSEAVRELLHAAMQARPEERGSLLWRAQAIAPDELTIYYVLYKHHARRSELAQAGRAAELGLAQAARLAGLDSDWREVQPEAGREFRDNGPARFWLFTLKALAFVHLRAGNSHEAAALLAQITKLAPEADIGAEVIAAMLASTQPDAR